MVASVAVAETYGPAGISRLMFRPPTLYVSVAAVKDVVESLTLIAKLPSMLTPEMSVNTSAANVPAIPFGVATSSPFTSAALMTPPAKFSVPPETPSTTVSSYSSNNKFPVIDWPAIETVASVAVNLT